MNLKINLITRHEFDLTYEDDTVQYINHNTMVTTSYTAV